jgi:FtsP/CotA-like multicopper oxidase with cupredoxin domain
MVHGRKSFVVKYIHILTCFLLSVPAINVTEGDTLIINVINQLDIPTALHTHGMFQNGTPWMDGPVGVTQW